jgi:hypothetical protein
MSSRRGQTGRGIHVYRGASFSLALRLIKKFEEHVPNHISRTRLEQLLANADARPAPSEGAALDTRSSPSHVTPAMLAALQAAINRRRL